MLVSCGGLFCAPAGRAAESRNRVMCAKAIAAPRARDLVFEVIQGIPNEGGRRQAFDQHIAERTWKSTSSSEAARCPGIDVDREPVDARTLDEIYDVHDVAVRDRPVRGDD